MLTWFKSWKVRRNLQKLAREMGASLKQRYGVQEYYTPDQVLKAAELAGLNREAQVYAVVMYVQPENAQGILRKIDKTKLAEQVRAFMIATCFGSSGGYDGYGYTADYNLFMHHDAVTSHHSSHHSGGSSDGSLGQHSHGGGHSGGNHSHDGGHSGGHSCSSHSCGGSH